MLVTFLVLITRGVKETVFVNQAVAVVEHTESKLVILEKTPHTVL